MVGVTLERVGNQRAHLPVKMTVGSLWRQSLGSEDGIGKSVDGGWHDSAKAL